MHRIRTISLVASTLAATVGATIGLNFSASAASRPAPTATTRPPVTVPPTTAPTRPVSPPTQVRLVGQPTANFANVTWDPSFDVVYYTVLLNGVVVPGATCSGGPYCFGSDAVSGGLSGLKPSTTYSVVIVANRYAGGTAASAPLVFTTPAA